MMDARAEKQAHAAIVAALPGEPAEALRVLMRAVAVVGFGGCLTETQLYDALRDGLREFDAHAKVRPN